MSKTISKETFTLACTGDTHSLCTSASHHPSPKVMEDHNFSWRKMILGKNKILECMLACGWPAKHIRALETLFYDLNCHILHNQELEDTLLLYQERVCTQWHLDLKRNKGQDISSPSVLLLQLIHVELMHKEVTTLM